jgi:hypothetical protein
LPFHPQRDHNNTWLGLSHPGIDRTLKKGVTEMAGNSLRRLFAVMMALLAGAGLALPAQVHACPFCSMQGQTLVGDIGQASMVLYGSFTNAVPGADEGQGSTDLQIDAIIKTDPILGDKKVITLPRYVPTDKNAKVKFLVFCDVFKGKIDPYRGVPVQADSDIVKYLKGSLEVKDKDISARLRFAFDYLDNKEIEISNDAYKEFGNAAYADYKDMAAKLPADKIAKWLSDPETPSFRYGLYASMLGHCGTAKDADLLRKLLDDPQRRVSSGLDGMMAGDTLLKPKEGMAYIRSVLSDSKKEFMHRYAALQAVRFFWSSEPNVVDQKELVSSVRELLNQSDIADLAIEDLRKWGRWECCDEILGLQSRKSHNVSIIRKAILRYALCCPGAKAAGYVQEWRKRDAETVKDTEELLKLETQSSAPVVSSKTTLPPLTSRNGTKVLPSPATTGSGQSKGGGKLLPCSWPTLLAASLCARGLHAVND